MISAFFTLLATGFQLYVEFNHERTELFDSIKFIEDSYVEPISASAFLLQKRQVRLLLQGAHKLQDIVYLEVSELKTSSNSVWITEGDPEAKAHITREFPLIYHNSVGERFQFGILHVSASFDGIYKRLLKRALIILGANAVKTFLASFCILLLFQFKVTRHLTAMAAHTEKLNLDQLSRTLVLRRGKDAVSKLDELDQVVSAINDMQIRLAIDMSRRKRAEHALRESEERYRAVVEDTPVMICRFLPGGIITFVNDMYCNYFESSADQLTGKSFLMFIPEADRETVMTNLSSLTAASPTQTHEHRVISPDGENCWQRWTNRALFDTRGHAIAYQSIGEDITARKKAEEAFEKAEEALRYFRNYLANIIDSMPSVLVGVDVNGKVTQWNKTAEQITGIAVGAAQGKILSDVFPRMASEMEKITESIRTRETRHERKRPRLSEKDACCEDVTIYPLIANGVEGAVIRIDDVTDKVRMEEMMIQSEKMLSVGGLAAGMAHEINNPLAGMIQTANVMRNRLSNENLPGNLRAAEAAGVSMEGIHTFMEARGILRMTATINESGQRVAEIVNNMLSFARKSDVAFSYRDVAELLDRTLALAAADYDLKKRYDFKTIKIIKEYAENLPAVSCEETKIQQVLLNLFGNGAQAMQGAGVEKAAFTLRTRYEPERARVCIEIEDNGPGMDEAVRKRVFEPFFTTKPAGAGTGLGLSVSYFIITENHGGEMSVESQPGVGTKFIIRLPI
ncbi:MAG: PAS domain S-box protein [Gammaproteobacteria bacterium]|nr:PAS domain S-box protein [Gammaproteobacteria bacterium]